MAAPLLESKDDLTLSSRAGPPAEIRYLKYSVAGNTFLIVDESRTPLPDDRARSAFARWALDGHFGVGGADNLLYISAGPETGVLTFRIFEQDGSETLSCGNGLLAAGHYAAEHLGVATWTFLTELPSGRPCPVRVETTSEGRMRVDIGAARAVPAELYRRTGRPPTGALDAVRLNVHLPAHFSGPVGPAWPDQLSGHLVFTGEPHLVFVCGHGAPLLDQALFPPEETAGTLDLMDYLGRQINHLYQDVFPHGVHVNFADIRGDTLRYRTWERAIDQETLACGTGALACAYVCRSRRLVRGNPVTLRPQRAHWHQPATDLRVTETPDGGLILEGRPLRICAGGVPPRWDTQPAQEVPR
jgi:diaminopimelate epimerase